MNAGERSVEAMHDALYSRATHGYSRSDGLQGSKGCVEMRTVPFSFKGRVYRGQGTCYASDTRCTGFDP